MSKKKFIWIAVATCVIALIYFHQDIIHKLDDADVFRIDDFHEFNADDKQNLKDILSKYDLEPISAGNFFSLRYAFSNDDMGGLVREFTCKTADFSKCTKTIYEDDGNNIHKTVKSTEQQEAKNIYNEFIELDIFDLKSIETKPLGVYLEIYNIAYLCSNLSIEVSDEKRLNRFSITPGKHNDERYAKIFNIFQTHDFLPEKPQKNTTNALDSKAIEKIQTFYSRHIFGNVYANDSVMAKYCTKELAQKLLVAAMPSGSSAVAPRMAKTFMKSKRLNLLATANISSITTIWATKALTPSPPLFKTARFFSTSWINLFLLS